jgi:uncharacterized protein (TIGR03492 family)
LLCLSNGHGEDAIAVKILLALRSLLPHLDISALPIVGEGQAFQKYCIPLIAATKTLPSGGFIYMDSRQLARDLHGGLVQLTLSQLSALKTWSQEGGVVLSVGDVIPAAFAWRSGLPYAIVGTAKSAYYLRDEQGFLPGLPWYAGWAGSMYLPWERWLMSRDRCRAVIVRDDLTANELRQLGISSVWAGNPMMDDLTPEPPLPPLHTPPATALTLVLLPGSRPPEAYDNWRIILQGVDSVLQQFPDRPLHCLGAIAPALDLSLLQESLMTAGWHSTTDDSPYPVFARRHGTILLSTTTYNHCLHLADAAIALAGTATEQFVGLGKPAFTIPGRGPQFNPTFARLQTRLLGESVILVPDPTDMGRHIAAVLGNPERLSNIRKNGLRRMGQSGAATAIAHHLTQTLLCPVFSPNN